MRMALEVKNKWGLVDGSIVAPNPDQPQHVAWKRCNMIVKSWLLKSMSPSIAQSVLYMEKAKSIWDDLWRRFSQGDLHRISQLQGKIYNQKQNGMSITDYYTSCKTLWEETDVLRPLPVCKCNPQCACDVIDIIRKEREIDQVIRFLDGLNEEFSNLKSNVLVLEPLHEVYRVFAMALKVKRQLNLVSIIEPVHANATQTRFVDGTFDEALVAAFSGKNNDGRKKYNSANTNKQAKCTYCGMNGHTVERCYKKHGYPPGWVPGYKSKARQASNQAQPSTAVVGSGQDNADIGLSSNQFQKLMAMVQSQMKQQPSIAATVSLQSTSAPKPTPSFTEAADTAEGRCTLATHVNSLLQCSSTWIVDTGVSDHITCCLDILMITKL